MKNNKYRDLCHSLGYSFLAAAIVIFGSMAKELVALIKNLVERVSARCLIPTSTLLPYWIKRLSIVIQRGNARYWFNANARMCGPTAVHDSSIDNATHHLRCVLE